MELHEKLQKIAREQNIKQSDLSRALNIPKTTISGYFRGTRTPPLETLKLLAHELNTTVAHILDEEEEQTVTLTTPTPTEFLAQQGITNPDHIASILNIITLMKTDAELDNFARDESSAKQAN